MCSRNLWKLCFLSGQISHPSKFYYNKQTLNSVTKYGMECRKENKYVFGLALPLDIQHSDSIYCCIMIYLFLDLKTWTKCGQDFPYPKEIFLAHKKCGTLCATTLYSWAYWQLFASIPSLFYFSYWSMFMYCICIIL
jgi:hypothetical protein